MYLWNKRSPLSSGYAPRTVREAGLPVVPSCAGMERGRTADLGSRHHQCSVPVWHSQGCQRGVISELCCVAQALPQPAVYDTQTLTLA